jgi:hypothetical protein
MTLRRHSCSRADRCGLGATLPCEVYSKVFLNSSLLCSDFNFKILFKPISFSLKFVVLLLVKVKFFYLNLLFYDSKNFIGL